MESKAEVKNRVKQLRHEAHLTQIELARRCKCAPSMISEIERGLRPITFRMAKLLASAFRSLNPPPSEREVEGYGFPRAHLQRKDRE